MLINIEPADLENAEVNINKLKSLLEMKDKEIKERDGNIESLTNDLESFISHTDVLFGINKQSKNINSPDLEYGLFNNEVKRKALYSAALINQEDNESQKKRKIKELKHDDASQGKLANKTDIQNFRTVTSSLTQSPPTPNTSSSENIQSYMTVEENKKSSKYFGGQIGRKASWPTRRMGNRVYYYKLQI